VDPNKIAIRLATPADSDRIAELCIQLGYSVSSEMVKRRLQKLSEKIDTAAFVAEINSFIAGWIQVGIKETIESGESAEITGLVVDEAARGKGTGGRLVKEAEDWVAALGYLTVRVRTNIVREDARCFYHCLGFEETKQQIVFSKRLLSET
jgi:N-acetylglutamate synthase-like GNAT family acetyltransferase